MGAASTKNPGKEAAPAAGEAGEQDDSEWEAFQVHQRNAARLPHAEEARLLFATAGHGVLSTIGSFGTWAGYPVGTVCEFAADETGRPVFAFSSLSSHTPDLRADPRASLTVTARGYQGMADARATISGSVEALGDAEEAAAARKTFLAKYPDSFWVDFGDFTWFRLEPIVTGRLISGFGRIKQFSGEEYLAARADPVAAFAAPIAGHMNADHAEATAAMLRHYAGLSVDEVRITGVDRLGLDLACKKDDQTLRARLPFVRSAEGRKDVKDIIVEMTRAAAGR
ncbi:hypothetical protein WJX81_003065 [Elliptochloris bilobata]|uniref:DUF2470 domain-containing protein n=1 Tax=Elliptochloris bilobata TaxID=381761 RepID=A0AAW1RBH0_9CHLO